jgi:hypothetical protein
LRPITGTHLHLVRGDSDRLRRQALWQRLDAIIALREIASAAARGVPLSRVIDDEHKQL